MKGIVKYSKRVWLNDEDSPSTGNVIAYDGIPEFDEGHFESLSLKISDCHHTVKLHKAQYDTIEDFIGKMKKLRTVVDEFIVHLETEYTTDSKQEQ